MMVNQYLFTSIGMASVKKSYWFPSESCESSSAFHSTPAPRDETSISIPIMEHYLKPQSPGSMQFVSSEWQPLKQAGSETQ